MKIYPLIKKIPREFKNTNKENNNAALNPKKFCVLYSPSWYSYASHGIVPDQYQGCPGWIGHPFYGPVAASSGRWFSHDGRTK
jgi:hypothetical protein